MNTPSKTVVLIHGLWVTPRSWENFKHRYEARGYTVLAPAWPGIAGDPANLRRDAASLHGVGIAEVVAHYEKIIRALPEPPIIIGHSYGGLITQLLLDRGLGAAGVAIDSVPPKGIYVLPVSTYEALTPALVNPAVAKRTYAIPFARWWRVFAGTLPEAEARAAYDAQVIPASGRAIFQAALSNVTPGSLATVNFANPNRAPLLVIGGGKDVIMPAALSRKIYAKHRASPVRTDYKEFADRDHYLVSGPGWEEVADHALDWAESATASVAPASASSSLPSALRGSARSFRRDPQLPPDRKAVV